jgi:hypothetical protein
MSMLKSLMKITLFNFVLGLVAFSAAMGEEVPPPFSYSPVPRWSAEPENDQVCEAVKKECAKAWKSKQSAFEMNYDLLYSATGDVTGIRITKSSACKPVDEYYQYFKRSMMFSPKLEGMRVELAPNVKPEDVRIIRSDTTNFNFSCQ